MNIQKVFRDFNTPLGLYLMAWMGAKSGSFAVFWFLMEIQNKEEIPCSQHLQGLSVFFLAFHRTLVLWGLNNMHFKRKLEKKESMLIQIFYRFSHSLKFIPEMGSAFHEVPLIQLFMG